MKTISKLIGLMVTFRKFVILAIILGWATTMSWIALLSTSSYLISYAALQPSIAELQVAIVGVRFFGLSRGVFRYLERLISHTVTFKLLSNLRTWFYERIEPLAPAGLQDFQKGDLLSRILDDVEVLQEFYVRVFGPSVVSLLSSLTVFWFFGQWSNQFALVIFGFHMTVGVIVPLVTQKISGQAAKQIVKNRATLSVMAVDTIQGSAEIIAFGQEATNFRNTENIIQGGTGSERKINYIQSVSAGLVSTSINLTAFVLLLIAIPMVNSGSLDGKILAVVILGSIASFEAISLLPQAYQNFEGSIEAGRRLFEIVDRRPELEGKGTTLEDISSPSLELKNIYFSYSHDFVLEGISFSMPYGKKTAIVGLSGSGKTTITNLLMRFWNYTKGEILLNGMDILAYDQESVRKLMGYVPQETFIFNGTIAENIRIGKPTATMEEIVRAAQKAFLHNFIISLPKAYKTHVGEKGAFLSGGERQRISIARAAIRNVPIYIFDEPYKNLDQITQKSVHESIMNIVQDRSLLLITHYITDLASMDEIIVLKESKIIERGTEEELIAQKSEFRKMLELQQDVIKG
jgi:ATP-binding cassette subfamily C protein CydC